MKRKEDRTRQGRRHADNRRRPQKDNVNQPSSLELVFLLDTSGSMFQSIQDLIGGFNSMITEQKQERGECKVSVVTFNNDSRVVIRREDLQKVCLLAPHSLQAEGMTALYDAIGQSIDYMDNLHKQLGNKAPDNTMFVIMTDGQENASRKYSQRLVKYMIDDMQKNHGWKFIFTGANIDTEQVAEDLAIAPSMSASFHQDSAGFDAAFNSFGAAVRSVRRTGVLDEDWSLDVDEDYEGRN